MNPFGKRAEARAIESVTEPRPRPEAEAVREAVRALAASLGIGADADSQDALAETLGAAAKRARELTAERDRMRLALELVKANLPFSSAILAVVPAETENAAFGLMEKFQVVRDDAARGAAAAAGLEALMSGADGSVSVRGAADHATESVRRERETLDAINSSNAENERGLQAMSREIGAGIDLLRGIEENNERSRLIAFNLAIEAAHIGEAGKGFKIIAGELRTLNTQSSDISRKVAEMLHRFRDANAALVKNVGERSNRVASDVEAGMKATEEAVATLVAASRATEEFAAEMSSISRSIDGNLDGVLESLQFQDITRQMVEGAVAALSDARIAAEEAGGKALDRGFVETARERALARAKTRGEKDAIAGVRA